MLERLSLTSPPVTAHMSKISHPYCWGDGVVWGDQSFTLKVYLKLEKDERSHGYGGHRTYLRAGLSRMQRTFPLAC